MIGKVLTDDEIKKLSSLSLGKMTNKQISINRLNEILETTITIIKSRDEVFEIVTYSREECNRMEEELKAYRIKLILLLNR